MNVHYKTYFNFPDQHLNFLKRHIIFFFFLLNYSLGAAQDITGTWEGDLGNDQFIQVNVIQVKNQLCGYTWDYIYANQRSYCKA